MHIPPRQSCPQLPQFFASPLMSTHAFPQDVRFPVQLIPHIEPLHTGTPPSVVGHAVPHTPPAPHPFCGPGVSHVPLQFSVFAGQPQLPLEHTCPPVHAFPQPPQFLLSLE
jgi:hypothetical protein